MIDDLADGGNDRRRAAESAFCHVGQLGEINLALLNGETEIFLCHVDETAAGDRGKNAVRLRGNDLALLRDEEDVRAAGFLDLGAGLGVEIDVLVVALLVRVYDVVEAHRVVQTCLDVAGSARCGTVEIRDAEGQRTNAALEVRTDGRAEETELIFHRRLNADDRAGRKEVGTEIEGCARAVGGNPSRIGGNRLLDGLDEAFLREYGDLQLTCRVLHTCAVQIGAEGHDMTVLGRIGLESLKAGLCILQNACAFGDGNGRFGRQTALVPCAVLEVGDIAKFCGEVAEAKITPINIFLFHKHDLAFLGVLMIGLIIAQEMRFFHRFSRKISHFFIFFAVFLRVFLLRVTFYGSAAVSLMMRRRSSGWIFASCAVLLRRIAPHFSHLCTIM